MKTRVLALFILSLFCMHSRALNALSEEYYPDSEYCNLLKDLMICEKIDRCINDRFPVYYNHLLQGGYINMPSARGSDEGEIGIGYAYVSPYRIWSLRAQLTDYLEFTGNYRIFTGIKDPILSPHGFGDFSDKGANIKLIIVRPEDSEYCLPGFAVGFDDFLGTRSFKGNYFVFTQVIKKFNLEFSIGYGHKRFHKWFGGISLTPFWDSCYPFLQPLTFVAEYDAIPYKNPKREPHPEGRSQKNCINFGVKYRLWDFFDFSLSYIRGEKLAFSTSINYNWGYTRGFLPKIDNPLPYIAPINVEPLGCLRPEDALVQDLLYPFKEHGFDLLEARMYHNWLHETVLFIRLYNNLWRLETDTREQITHILSALTPENIDKVIVVMEADGMPIQEYRFQGFFLTLHRNKLVGPFEMEVVSPLCEVPCPPLRGLLLFKQSRELFNVEIYPKTNTLFGSSKGKFKYAVGIHVGLNGFIFENLYYSVLFGINISNDLHNIKSIDRLNPSQIINVRSDIIRYYKRRGITIDEAYLQRNFRILPALYSRLAFGYFEEQYGGIASEILYYPLRQPWAIGIEGAILKKRSLHGLGFTSRIRKLDGFEVKHKSFPFGSQYFLDLYYNWCDARLDFKIKTGKFLANDYGARFEVSRYFPSGLKITFWYTRTTAHDVINGQRYHDKGISFSMPLDIFYTHSDRSRWGYGMSAWIRDVGVSSSTGRELYDMIRDHRERSQTQIN